MAKRNFLLGKGERLTEQVRIVSGGAKKVSPYTFSEAQERLQPMLSSVANAVSQLPDDACPQDFAVATITLNPEYTAKSYYPGDLLRAVGLETVGSRPRLVRPDKRSKEREPEDSQTTELFVVGKRSSYVQWANRFELWSETSPGAEQIPSVEQIGFQTPQQKIKSVLTEGSKLYEIVLHLNEQLAESGFLGYFQAYLQKLNVKASFDKRFYAGGLCFVELEAPTSSIEDVAKFSLVRAVREMPALRLVRPAFRAGTIENSRRIVLPDQGPMDSKVKVAIFDGGIPNDHPITKWATPFELSGMIPADPELLEHGVGVTSAFLFGHIDPKKSIPQPYANVDHFRVLDNVPGQNPYELFEVLDRINNILKQNSYDFINLSLGPRLPIDDDDVHAWTAVLDEHLSHGMTLATIAVGNDGEGEASIGANRVQVPADCVNAMGIGACDIPDEDWQRAPYSSVGPGRSPGLVKPDLVDFGGSIQRPFLTLDASNGNRLIPTGGTSFASPSVLRIGTGVRAHFGTALKALAIRTLLVHCAEESDIPNTEVGWGRIARDLEDIVICDDHVMRVVYQGQISASKYIRVPIPLPAGQLDGMITIKATLCYATEVDPHHPGNYTRSGLEVSFRPDVEKHSFNKETQKESAHPVSKSFFGKSQKTYKTELELRQDAFKWENCLHAKNRFRGTSLNSPFFDIHYNARLDGHNDGRSQEILYALVVTVEAPKVSDLYDQVVRRYATQLEQLQPIIDVPVRIK